MVRFASGADVPCRHGNHHVRAAALARHGGDRDLAVASDGSRIVIVATIS